MFIRILFLSIIVLALFVQSVIGEWGFSFILLLFIHKRFPFSWALMVAFLLGLAADVLNSTTVGSLSIVFLSFLVLAKAFTSRHERHPLVYGLLTGIIALGLLVLHRSIEQGHFSIVPSGQMMTVMAAVAAAGTFLELSHRQPGITLRS